MKTLDAPAWLVATRRSLAHLPSFITSLLHGSVPPLPLVLFFSRT